VNHGKEFDSGDGNWDYLKTFKRIETYGNDDLRNQICSKSVMNNYIQTSLGGRKGDFRDKIIKSKQQNQMLDLYQEASRKQEAAKLTDGNLFGINIDPVKQSSLDNMNVKDKAQLLD
jgi:hypothetical protein